MSLGGDLCCGFIPSTQFEQLHSTDYRVRELTTSNLISTIQTTPSELIDIEEFLKVIDPLLRDPNMKVVQNSYNMLKTLITNLDQNCALHVHSLVKTALALYMDTRKFVRQFGNELITQLLKILSPSSILSEMVRTLHNAPPQVAVESLEFVDSLVQFNVIPSVLLTQFTFYLDSALNSPHVSVQTAANKFLNSLAFRDPTTYGNIIGNLKPESLSAVERGKKDYTNPARRSAVVGRDVLSNNARLSLSRLFARASTSQQKSSSKSSIMEDDLVETPEGGFNFAPLPTLDEENADNNSEYSPEQSPSRRTSFSQQSSPVRNPSGVSLITEDLNADDKQFANDQLNDNSAQIDQNGKISSRSVPTQQRMYIDTTSHNHYFAPQTPTIQKFRHGSTPTFPISSEFKQQNKNEETPISITNNSGKQNDDDLDVDNIFSNHPLPSKDSFSREEKQDFDNDEDNIFNHADDRPLFKSNDVFAQSMPVNVTINSNPILGDLVEESPLKPKQERHSMITLNKDKSSKISRERAALSRKLKARGIISAQPQEPHLVNIAESADESQLPPRPDFSKTQPTGSVLSIKKRPKPPPATSLSKKDKPVEELSVKPITVDETVIPSRSTFAKERKRLSSSLHVQTSKDMFSPPRYQAPAKRFDNLMTKLHSTEWSDQNDAILSLQSNINDYCEQLNANARDIVQILAECGSSLRTALAKNALSLLLIMIKDDRIDCATIGEAAGASLLHIVSAGRQFISAIACDCFDALVDCMNPSRASAMLIAESKRKQDKSRARVAAGIGIIAHKCPNDHALRKTCETLTNDANQEVRRIARLSLANFD